MKLTLAYHITEDTLHVGWWSSTKLDGVRAWWDGTKLRTRNQRIIDAPPEFLKQLPSGIMLDGELYWPNHFAQVNGTARRKRKTAEDNAAWKYIKYYVFDILNHDCLDLPFRERYEWLKKVVAKMHNAKLKLVKQTPIKSTQQVTREFQKVIRAGGEGLIIRNPNSPYEGRRSRNWLKWKPKRDAEAKVLGFNPDKHNARLGTFRVRMLTGAKREFNLSGRMSNNFRNHYKFDSKGKFLKIVDPNPNLPRVGDKVTYQYMSINPSGKPRQPIFIRKR